MKISIEKIKQYNQVLLALAGTFGLVFLVGAVVVTALDEFRFRSNSFDDVAGVLSDQRIDSLQANNIRNQIISFKGVELIDTSNSLYLIPITQADVGDESTNEMLGLLNVHRSNESMFLGYRESILNNMVIYDVQTQKSEILFDERIGIKEYKILKQLGQGYIAVIGTQVDSNKDGYLNSSDNQQLFIYSLQDKKVSLVEMKEYWSLLSMIEDTLTDRVFVSFGVDRNKSGEIERGEEPIFINELNLKGSILLPILSDTQINTLQELLEGSN